MGFPLVVEHWTSSTLLIGFLRGHLGFAQPVHMCFVDLERECDRVLWGVLRGSSPSGVSGSLLRTLFDWSLVRISGSKAVSLPVKVGLCQGCPLSQILFTTIMDRI